jgi:hypothetical protein
MYYRVLADEIGIYEAVERDCPKEDQRRKNKPDGSWLPKVGPKYPGAISFWTEKGWEKYKQSGLFDWHKSVVKGKVEIVKVQSFEKVLFEDEFQIIVENY